jgi:hypothetical protein
MVLYLFRLHLNDWNHPRHPRTPQEEKREINDSDVNGFDINPPLAGEGVAFGNKILHLPTQIVPQMLRPYTYLIRRYSWLEKSIKHWQLAICITNLQVAYSSNKVLDFLLPNLNRSYSGLQNAGASLKYRGYR